MWTLWKHYEFLGFRGLAGISVGLSWLVTLGSAAAAQTLQTPQTPAPVGLGGGITLQTPDLLVPDLPSLGEATRYLPEDRTVHLVLNLGHRKVYVYAGETLVASYPVAIGRPGYATPTGEFQVFEMIVNPAWQSPWTGEIEPPGPDGSLGLRWIGFARLSGGVIGFHGTPNVASIGQAASHGCVRMRNEDVVKLFEQVEIGTRVRVEP
ncbi:MAG: L,D-transpeptidase [Synechococcales cyanobacterium C42_A2020_086]|jgi:hypothetical protein|nr:L,D-transpeptidase [Synechococcales cyanobacterium C42_A2020_086]